MKLLNNIIHYAFHICICWTICAEVISWVCTNPNRLRAGRLHLRTDVPPYFRRFSLGPSRLGMVPVQGRRSWALTHISSSRLAAPGGRAGRRVAVACGCGAGAKGSCWSSLEARLEGQPWSWWGTSRGGRRRKGGQWGSAADRGGLGAEARGQRLYITVSVGKLYAGI